MAAKSLPTTTKQTAGLPTPPNSISPSLPPQAYKGHTASDGPPTPPPQIHVDSDIDLDDAVEHAKAQDSPQRGLAARGLGNLADLDAAGAITPGLLAKHHLPGILLNHGAMAIRHIMGFLTTSVPGFSGIPPAKARRLVVGALEGRGSDGQQGGIEGDILFEKVGWGKWGARKRGEPIREATNTQHCRVQPHHKGSLRIPVQSSRHQRTRDRTFGTSHDSEREYDTPMEDVSTPEHEADGMSFDGINSCSSYDPPDDKPKQDYDMEDVTEEEDWASIGAAALRQGSFPLTGGLMPTNHRYYPHIDPRSRGRGPGGRSSATLAKSMPMTNSVMYNRKLESQQQPAPESTGFSPLPRNGLGSSDAQDREAVEALLKLSSV